ncbi:carotenoid oxygenase family protein [Parasphingopyxis marina]|uniref:Dioxygenase n=1 Tax=Parasphingopyxis marina TaxID=2761622 RepID=A0A842HVT9_9SPHN|nr:carotenoid oxygenase family protein [Parasphingopyxis marina]MBC2777082.1 carotenoid oxygenase family protein [Parasphingopyxis marina]
MSDFPRTVQFMGLNEPIRWEGSTPELEIEGEIPAEIQGAFFRAVPDPAHVPFVENDVLLSADGMVSRILIKDGKVSHDCRYVHTARWQAEHEAGRALFGRYRNPFTDDPSVEGVDRTVSNTTPVWHAGKLYLTKEDGRAYRVDPHTLETLGSWDFDGALKSETMTAHVRIDPETKEMFFFGYEADGLASKNIAYCVVDPQGNLVSEQSFDAPYCSMMHDFAISEKYALFPVFPTTSDIDVLKEGGPHWIHHQDWDSWIGVVPRGGSVEDVRWFRGPKGVHVYHIVNAFDEGGKVHIDMCQSDSNAFGFIREDSGITIPQHELGGGLVRWTLDMDGDSEEAEVAVIGPPGDLPRVRDADMGRPYAMAWYGTIDPEGPPPLMGGPVGIAFTALLAFDPARGVVGGYTVPPMHAIHEPVHVPSSQEGHGGWLVATADRMNGPDDYDSELWIFEADAIGKGPIASAKFPERIKPQVHGWWVPLADYEAAKA